MASTRYVERIDTLIFALPDYKKSCNLIGWIIEHGPSTHFPIDGPDHLYGFLPHLKDRFFLENGIEIIDRGS